MRLIEANVVIDTEIGFSGLLPGDRAVNVLLTGHSLYLFHSDETMLGIIHRGENVRLMRTSA